MDEGQLDFDQENLLCEGIRFWRPSQESWQIRGSNHAHALRQKVTKKALTKKTLRTLARP
jgi:hypothetical protein